MDEGTIDRITLDVARTLMDDADLHHGLWVEGRAGGASAAPDTGLAQAGDFGAGLFPVLHDLIASAALYAEQWWATNHGSVEANALTAAILAFLQGPVDRSGVPPGRAVLGEDEEPVIEKVAEEVAGEVARGPVP